jgi:hypothetical protein
MWLKKQENLGNLLSWESMGFEWHELKDVSSKKDANGILKMEFVAGDVWGVCGKIPKKVQNRFPKHYKRF